MFGRTPGQRPRNGGALLKILRSSGKVRYFGISISEHEPDSALEAIKTGLVQSVQVIYNIFDQTRRDETCFRCASK